MKIIEKSVESLREYEFNPRNNDDSVEAVASSIREFGFKVPIVIDRNGIIVAGHTRLKAAKSLGMKRVPCIVADDLTDEQVKAFRIADNKVAELSGWNFDLLDSELKELGDIDMSQFGFDVGAFENSEWFLREKKDGAERQEGNDEYNEFLEKFEIEKTTDDCYTPDIVYDAIADWVAEEYGVKRKNFARPFYPNGDYKKENYKGKIVVDNPPFSILSEIVRYYMGNDIPFFIFAPTLTIIGSLNDATGVIANGIIEYENGAKVNTSFITNLEENGIKCKTSPELSRRISEANEKNTKAGKREIPRYEYPDHVATAAMLSKYSKYGVDFEIKRSDCVVISGLDSQKKAGKDIFGRGLLLSEQAAAERAAAERAAAERAVAEIASAERWELSERERDIIRKLGER